MKGFGNLMDIAQAKELQKLEAAQREKEIEDLWVNLGKRLNESLDTVNGIKKETIVKVWDSSKVELDSIVNASKAHKNQVEVYQAKIMNCANVSQADPIYAQLQVYHQQEMAKLQATANSFIQKCVSKANELMLPGQVEQLQLNNPVMNPGANDDLLQQLQALQQQLAQKDEVLAQKDGIINSLSQGMQMAYSAVTQVQTQLQEKDAIIAEKDTIIAEKDDVIVEKNNVIVEKDTHIQSLTDTNLELTDRVENVTNRYDTLKAHFIDLVDFRFGRFTPRRSS